MRAVLYQGLVCPPSPLNTIRLCVPYCPRTFCPCSCSFFVTSCMKYILDYSVRPICLPWTRKLLAHIFSDIIYMDSRCFGPRLNRGPQNKTWLLGHPLNPEDTHPLNPLKSPTHWILKSSTPTATANDVSNHMFLFNFKPLKQNYELFAWERKGILFLKILSISS
jgi:hypothetical protein